MKTPLRILHLEDNPNDVELIREAIIAQGIDAEIVDASTRADFVAALENGTYDLVLADYTLPSFDGLSALIIVREKFPKLPFIFVTGTMGEEKAVETFNKGATDYVLKHNLTRLVPSIMRALREAEEHIERKKAQKALRESEERFRMLVESAPEAIFVQSQGCFVYLNPAMVSLLGVLTPEELLGKEIKERIAPEYHEAIRERIRVQLDTGNPAPLMEQEYLRLDGSRVPVETTAVTVRFQDRDAHLVFVRDITERKRSDEELKFRNVILSTQQEVSIDGILVVDESNAIISYNQRFIEMWGIPSKLIESKDDEPVLQYVATKPVDPEGFLARVKYLYEHREEKSHEDIALKDGRVFDRYSAPMFGLDGKYYGRVWYFRDITERKQAEQALKKLHHHNELLLNSAAEGIIGLDLQGNHAFVNPSAAGMLGYEVEELIGKQSHIIWHHSKADGSIYPEVECPIYATLKDGKVHSSIRDEVFWRKDGTSFSVAYSSNPIMDEGKNTGAVVNFRDITERKQMEEKLQYLAYYDSLTGLPNRNLFIDRLKQGIARAEHTSRIVTVLITNIDRFKSINDTYGSEIGDRVLKEIAGRLSTSVRKGDTIARLSNDEFGIALLDVAHPDDIVMVLEKIIKGISYPLNIAGDELALSFSTGISLYPNDGEDTSELLKSAGLALGIAKKEGGKTCQFYNKEMNLEAVERMLLEKQLMKAIKDKEFILHYQPYWDITTKKMVGMEALVRWQSKDKGLVPPGKFIPVLEDTGMIIEVGEWILREATRQVKEWQNNEYPIVPVSVNLSLIQFRQKDLAGMIKKIMKDCGYYPSLLTLEITESAFMQDIEFTRSVLTELKETGCSVSIDDFGTGYSSLAYLKRFPVDNLKIDISFIREMVRDPDSASIVMAIINMAHTLNLKTIAEGIETEEQWNFLRLLRCDMGQGFYLSKPLPAEDFEKLLIC